MTDVPGLPVTDPLTSAELRFQHARLTLDAEKLRAVWRGTVATLPRAAALGRQVRSLEARAADYRRILGLLGLDT